jgi:integrase
VAVLAALPAQLQHVVTFGYITGWRLGEVLNLQWRSVDLKAGEVRLDPGRSTKNRKGRTFVMTSELHALLEQREAARQKLAKRKKNVVTFAKRQTEFVFTKKNGAKIGSFRKWWWRACREAGIPDRIVVKADGSQERHPGRIIHDLRRTAVRNSVRAGIARSVAMRLSGHRTESVFERYNIPDRDELREAARKLEAAR